MVKRLVTELICTSPDPVPDKGGCPAGNCQQPCSVAAGRAQLDICKENRMKEPVHTLQVMKISEQLARAMHAATGYLLRATQPQRSHLQGIEQRLARRT